MPQPRLNPFLPIPRSSSLTYQLYRISYTYTHILITMPGLQIHRDYPLIDSDPHFSRVVRYFRPSDYATWGIATAAGPTALYLFGMSLVSPSQWNKSQRREEADGIEKVDPTKYKYGIKPALRLTGFLGCCAGFMLAYQRSSCMSPHYLLGVVADGRS